MLASKFSFQFVPKKKLNHFSDENMPASLVQRENTIVDQEKIDSDKRNLLKIAGIAGAGFVASQLIPNKASALIMGGTPSSSVVGVKDSSNTRIDPATETTVAAIKTQTNKLTFDGSNNLYVNAATNFSSQIENASSVVINPATEETLATIKTQANKFTFDGSGNLLTAGGAAASIVGLKDTTSTQVNPATDDSVVYLRRIVKLMESQAAVDSANRQRITLDSLGTGTAITTTVPVSGSITATVASTTITSISAGTSLIGGVTIDGQGRQMLQDFAKTAYATGIRQNLIFS